MSSRYNFFLPCISSLSSHKKYDFAKVLVRATEFSMPTLVPAKCTQVWSLVYAARFIAFFVYCRATRDVVDGSAVTAPPFDPR